MGRLEEGPQGRLDECAIDRELRHGWIAASRPLDRLAVRENEDDRDGPGPRQADVADRFLGNVGHSGSDFVPPGGPRAAGQPAIGWAVMCGIAGRPSRLGWSDEPTSASWAPSMTPRSPDRPPSRWRPSQWSARCTGRAFQGMGSHASMGQEDRSRSEIA
jgi:hypothetical protein